MIEAIETVWIDMPDGARLAGRLWLPNGARQAPAPCVLEYIPYRRRDRTRLRDESMHPRFAEAGYAALRVDMRGTGDSDGVMLDEYSEQETRDGHDVVAWIAAQDWCDGSVGMFGKSWGAYAAFQVAATRPPALKAIAPVMGTDDRWLEDIHFYGGVPATDNFWWGAVMQLFNAAPPDPAVVGARWRDMWRERLDAMTFWPAQWLAHQTRDGMWRRGSISENYDDVDIPVYFFGGWADLFRDTPFRIAERLKGPVKVLMGPWAHLYPHEGAPGPQVDFIAELLRFWDETLRGRRGGLFDEPPLRFWLQDGVKPAGALKERPGRWVEEPRWPSPNVAAETLHLNCGTLGRAAEDGPALSIRSPQTFGAAGGDMCSFAIPGDMPLDCRADASGALTFRGAPASAPVDILGQPSVRLVVAADRPQGFVAALLIDEAPDGTQALISRGFCNLTHRFGDEAPTPIVPGEEMEASVPLHGTGYRLAVGRRLVLQISSAYWPILWPAPEPVTLTIRPGASTLTLPVRSGGQGEAPRPLAPPPAQRADGAEKVAAISAGSLERTIETDLTTGRQTCRTFIDGGVFGPVGRVRLEETGTEMGDVSERIYAISPDDPLSARATMTQTSRMGRDGWRIRVDTTAEMTATAEAFHLTATVTCRDEEEEAEPHHVRWTHDIPRNGM